MAVADKMFAVNIPYIKLSAKAESFCLETMVKANQILKKWSEFLGGRKSQEFRKQLFKGHYNSELMSQVENKIPCHLINDFRSERCFIISVHVEEHECLDNRTVEWAMMCGYSALARKHARSWFKFQENSAMTLSDYIQDSYLTLLDCIYSYDDIRHKFSTFAWRSLRNKMIVVTNKNNMLCPLTNPDLELLTQYREVANSFNGPATFDEIVHKMGIGPEGRKTLAVITAKVALESECEAIGEHGDYTSLRHSIDEHTDEYLLLELREAIEKANLSEFERKVLATSMYPHHGWQAELASQTINPKTLRPYTRMWVGIVLNDIHEKIRKAMARSLNIEIATPIKKKKKGEIVANSPE